MSNFISTRNLHFGAVDASILLASAVICFIVARRFRGGRATPLKGPPSKNFLFGLMPYLMRTPDIGAVYEEWAHEYGSVFSVPTALGRRKVVLADPKALTHFSAKETYGYVHSPQAKRSVERFIGRGLFWAEGDSHKRQRRALNPAFSNTSIKNLTPIFFDSAYKAKAAWDAKLEAEPSSEGTIIEVQHCLDTIGLTGFSHDFGALSGRASNIATVFDSIGSLSFMDVLLFMLSSILPVPRIPTARQRMLDQLTKTMTGLADKFLATTGDVTKDRSVIGLLVNAASTDKISHEEVIAQINVLLVAGYETTAKLSRNPTMQTKLRNEILQASGDLTWDEMNNHSSFLDAFTCEILRLHPPVPEATRMAAEDDIIPLSMPIQTARGESVDAVFVRKGTMVTFPIECINRSVAFWGPDAKEFNPSRWLDDSVDQHRAQEIQGYRHLLTFSDGARMCLGKVFAVMEFKAVLSVLVRNFTYEFPKGPETVIGRHRNILPRPKVEGEDGYAVPLRVRNYIS
ncbi:cytochrome P450 [Mycena leptocephala]|nr:cytochrome P450 [Mycena leptocephala]